MNKKPVIIGLTTEMDSIAELLGVQNEREFGLYQETDMGKYYARFLPDGTFDNKLVRLVSYEQADELEKKVLDLLDKAEKDIQEVIDKAPSLDKEQMTKNLKDKGFQPTYRN